MPDDRLTLDKRQVTNKWRQFFRKTNLAAEAGEFKRGRDWRETSHKALAVSQMGENESLALCGCHGNRRLESETHREGKTALCYLCITFQVHVAYYVSFYIIRWCKTARDDILHQVRGGNGKFRYVDTVALRVAAFEAKSLVNRSTGLSLSLKA